MNKKARFYHSGETDDYRTFFKWIREQFPSKEIYAVGFSLGGNALVKYLGEEGSESMVERAVAVCPPYDLKEGSLKLHKGFNRLYEINFLKTLVEKLEMKRRKISGMPNFLGKSIYEFDDQVTAPLHGFKNAEDYYHLCSSKHFYGAVKKDLFIIHSKEDTLCPIQYAPFEIIEKNTFIQTCFTEKGGHVGFISTPRGWLFRTIVHWLNA